MFKGVIICADGELSADLKEALEETHRVAIMREVKLYLNSIELVRFLRASSAGSRILERRLHGECPRDGSGHPGTGAWHPDRGVSQQR